MEASAEPLNDRHANVSRCCHALLYKGLWYTSTYIPSRCGRDGSGQTSNVCSQRCRHVRSDLRTRRVSRSRGSLCLENEFEQDCVDVCSGYLHSVNGINDYCCNSMHAVCYQITFVR